MAAEIGARSLLRLTTEGASTEVDAEKKPRREESCGAETFGKEVSLSWHRCWLMPKRCELLSSARTACHSSLLQTPGPGSPRLPIPNSRPIVHLICPPK